MIYNLILILIACFLLLITQYILINYNEYYVCLCYLHSKLKLDFGSFEQEYPEQIMVVKFLKGHEKVLEIGANIGRNTLIIASILDNQQNLVTMESCPNIFKQLQHNKILNNMNFFTENSALSKKKLIQKDWDTIQSDVLLDGYQNVNTITYDQLRKKYNIRFDTLVLDCEGAFYYILQDMPEIIEDIKLIIMENDYKYKNYIDDILTKSGFKVVYSKSGGWGPCTNNFFEVWKK